MILISSGQSERRKLPARRLGERPRRLLLHPLGRCPGRDKDESLRRLRRAGRRRPRSPAALLRRRRVPRSGHRARAPAPRGHRLLPRPRQPERKAEQALPGAGAGVLRNGTARCAARQAGHQAQPRASATTEPSPARQPGGRADEGRRRSRPPLSALAALALALFAATAPPAAVPAPALGRSPRWRRRPTSSPATRRANQPTKCWIANVGAEQTDGSPVTVDDTCRKA